MGLIPTPHGPWDQPLQRMERPLSLHSGRPVGTRAPGTWQCRGGAGAVGTLVSGCHGPCTVCPIEEGSSNSPRGGTEISDWLGAGGRAGCCCLSRFLHPSPRFPYVR